MTSVDQEARESIVSIADLLDHFCHRIELHEEELWARFERSTEGSWVVRLVESLDVQITSLGKQAHELETRALTNQLKISSDRHCMD